MCAGEKNILEKNNISCVGLLHWKWKYDIWSDLRHCSSCKEKQNLYTYSLIVLFHDKSFLSFHWNMWRVEKQCFLLSVTMKMTIFSEKSDWRHCTVSLSNKKHRMLLEVISNHYCPKFVVLSYLKKKKKKKKKQPFCKFFQKLKTKQKNKNKTKTKEQIVINK